MKLTLLQLKKQTLNTLKHTLINNNYPDFFMNNFFKKRIFRHYKKQHKKKLQTIYFIFSHATETYYKKIENLVREYNNTNIKSMSNLKINFHQVKNPNT